MPIAIFRTIALYLLIILGIRLMGKRQVGELEPSELVFTLLIADLAAVPMQDFGIPLLTGVIPIIALLCSAYILSVLTMRSIRFRSLMCGTPSIVVENGVICQAQMMKNRLTLDELAEELRGQGVTDLSTIQYAILETNGQLTVLPKSGEKPVTATQAGLHPNACSLPTLIINDGRLISHNLIHRGLNDTWLKKVLKSHNAKHVKDVYLLSVDEDNHVFFAKKEGCK